MNTTTPLPCDVLLCPRTRDTIIVPRGMLAIRLTPEQRRDLIEHLESHDNQAQ